ncbi:hypothetical protein C5167_040949 [Papaver somniferum]|uniref:DUF679 domain membrane protein 2 n=1 Tax=Papaver somniferum TaxID=3469 RepID=A0A4Y7IGI8_PAPSO|nr:hypothetical protein C5167_040949 [Papaver somniferum]
MASSSSPSKQLRSSSQQLGDMAFKGVGNLLKVLPTGTVFFYVGNDGVTHYGIATTKGLWPSSKSENLSAYKLRFGDFVHGFFTVLVFAVIVLLDPNTVGCYYPSFQSSQKVLLMALPPVVGAISSSVFMIFPNKRHGIGYPSSQTPQEYSQSSS